MSNFLAVTLLPVEEVDFSAWLEEQLSLRGWRPVDLANAAGLPNPTITRVLNGERRAGPEVATSIAAALNLSPEFVFRRAGLLPNSPATEPDLITQELVELLKHMKPAERREIVAYALFRFRRTSSGG